MKILVVEDEEKLAKLIRLALKKEGYVADYLTDGEQAQKRIALNYDDYDLVILDLMLPKKNGLEICKEMRSLGIPTPVLVLTATGEVDSKVLLLNSGADDYLVKPFDYNELISRVRALTRRPKEVVPMELKVADIVLNSLSQEITVSGKKVDFTLKEFRILEYFMRRPNQVLKREDILCNVWDFDYNSFSNVLDVFINKIRKKLDKNRSNGTIETVRGIGYKFLVK